jgi:CubicO group peptidase (beta-lactamase class C family)
MKTQLCPSPSAGNRRYLRADPESSFAALCGTLALIAGLFGAPAHGQTPPIATALDAAIREWMGQFDLAAASFAAMQDGVLVKSAGYGGMEAGKPGRLASLSKAITGVCVARLIDEGKLAFGASLGTVLAPAFKVFAEPADTRLKAITVEQLLTHRSGLPREAKVLGPPARNLAATFTKILATPLASDPGSAKVYSNIGYLTLGIVVETVTGQPYDEFCRAAALTPMQAAGAIDPALAARASSGGWTVSAIDYAKFIQVFDPMSALLGKTSRDWLDGRRGRPAYGLGISMLRTPRGIIYQHTGKVASRERSGSYVIKFDNGWTTVVLFEGNLGGPGYRDLQQRLTKAVRPTSNLPPPEVD